MHDDIAMRIRVWGARGSSPMPGPDAIEFGGHTSCVEVRSEGHVLILDAGTGIIPLGRALMEEGVKQIDLFFSHVHYDHILGLPFFLPAFCPGIRLRIWSGHMCDGTTTEDLVDGIFRPPFFPITKDWLKANVEYRQFSAGDVLKPYPGLKLLTGALKHPGGAVGYRVETGGASFAYLTDFEHDGGTGDAEIVRMARRADLALIDAAYTPEEYPRYAGFGHSTWEKCGELCNRAAVSRWGLFHHMHIRGDADLRRIERAAQAKYPNVFAVRQDQRFELPARVPA